MKFTTVFALLATVSASETLIQFDDGALLDMTPEERETALLELEQQFQNAPPSEMSDSENVELMDSQNQPKTVKEVALQPLTAKEFDQMESTASETDADVEDDNVMDEDMDDDEMA